MIRKRIATVVLALAIFAPKASAQQLVVTPSPSEAAPATAPDKRIGNISLKRPDLIRAKGLSPEQADEAARAAREWAMRAPSKAPYTGPDANQEFWFVMPEGYKLGYTRGIYYSKGSSGTLNLLAADATNNMSARYNGAFVDGKLHTITGDLSWAGYGLSICRDHIYDSNNNWQLYKSVDMGENIYLMSQEVAVDPKTQRVYGTFLRDDMEGYDIAWVNYTTREIHRIGAARRDYPGLGMNSEGRLFGVDMDGVLYEISLADGSDRVIGRTGISVRDEDDRYFMQSAECGLKSNVLYWAPTFPDGKSALYAVDLQTAKATKVCDYPKYTLIHCLTVPADKASDGAPAAVGGLQATFVGTATTGQLAFVLPTTTYDGQALSGDVSYEVSVDGAATASGQAAPGSTVSVPLALAEGLHYLEVYAANQAGRSPQASTRLFVGLDQPGEPQAPTLTVRGLAATVAWQPAQGLYGGYPGELTYTVRRNGMIVGQGLTDCTFVDNLPAGEYQRVAYTVEAVSATATGPAASTRGVAVGTPYEVPYVEEFLSEDAFYRLYTPFDANGDDVTWGSSADANNDCAVYTYNLGADWTNVPADDWLFTPAFSLQAGRKYRLTLSEGCGGSDAQCDNRLEVKMGKGADVEAMTLTLMPATVFRNNTYFNDVVIEFTAPDDEPYNIGLHVMSDARKGDFIVDGLRLEEVTTDDSPAAPTGVTVTPGSKGALSATVSLVAPVETLGGSLLGSLSKVRVMRGNRTLHTFESPTPGQKLSFVDPAATNGFNTYTVVATNSNGDGPAAQGKAYVGIDIPQFDYTGVSIADGEDHVRVSWKPVSTTGLNGGYVDPATVGYAIYKIYYETESGYMTTDEYVDMAINTDHYDIPMNTGTGAQRVVSYAILAGNEIGADEQHMAATYGLPVGLPYALPFIQSAANSKLGNKFMWAETNNNAEATYTFSTDSYDGDNGSFAWSPASREYTLSLNTGKISLAGSSSPKLMFAHKAQPGVRFQMVVAVQTPDRIEHFLKAISYQSVTGSEAVWTLENLDLSPYKSEEYVVLKFKLSTTAATDRGISGKTLLIDAINVLDMQPYNLSIDIDAPETVIAGRGDEIGVVVHNVGERDASGYQVALYLDGETLLSETIDETLASLGQKTLTVSYRPTVFDRTGRSTLRAELNWLYDLDDVDNEMESELTIVPPVVATPRNAQWYVAGEGTNLKWEAPERVPELITESFEGPGYQDFDLCGITQEVHEGNMGAWTVWNLDADGTWNGPHGPTGHLPGFEETEFDGVTFPNMNQICAWMVFNNIRTMGQMPIVPRTGNKMAATFDDFVAQDTWLISPELSGNEQTISFYAAAPVTIDNLTGELDQTESFEVLYSKTTPTREAFQLLGEATFEDQEWADIDVELPSGAKYFAIRDVSGSYNAMAMFVDDVTFERLSPLPESYNIYQDEQWVCNAKVGDPVVVSGRPDSYCVTAVYADGDESLPVSFTETTGIRQVTEPMGRPAEIFDLQGRRVGQLSSAEERRVLPALPKGVYIVGGKTIVIP